MALTRYPRKQLKEGRSVCPGSQFESLVHHDEERMVPGVSGRGSHSICLREAEKDEAGIPVPSPLVKDPSP